MERSGFTKLTWTQVAEGNIPTKKEGWGVLNQIFAAGLGVLAVGIIFKKPKFTATGLGIIGIIGGLSVIEYRMNKPKEEKVIE